MPPTNTMDILTTTATQWQEHLYNSDITSVQLVDRCLEQIHTHNHRGQHLNALINVAPADILHARAQQLDRERAAGQHVGPMHGIPIIVKDIITTAEELGMPTTCGAMALRSAYGKKNCPLVQSLLDAGMIVLGKSNLNEYCRLQDVKSGWSALGGQSQSPYIRNGLDPNDTAIGNSSIVGSSSGSAASVAAGFAPVAIGTETVGSVVIPANRGGLYSLKVTNARARKEGVLTLSREHDSIGVMTKSAMDLRSMADILLGKSVKESKERGLSQARTTFRVGFVDPDVWRFKDEYCSLNKDCRELLAAKYKEVQATLRSNGVHVSEVHLEKDDLDYKDEDIVGLVVNAQFRDNFAEFTAGLKNTDVQSLADLVAYNEKHADEALPSPFQDQKALKRANEANTPETAVKEAIEHGREIAFGRLDQAMKKDDLDLIIGPGDSTIFQFSSFAGFPIGSLPLVSLNYDDKDSRPEGLLVVGRSDAEDLILDFMLKYEELFPGRPVPAPLQKST